MTKSTTARDCKVMKLAKSGLGAFISVDGVEFNHSSFILLDIECQRKFLLADQVDTNFAVFHSKHHFWFKYSRRVQSSNESLVQR